MPDDIRKKALAYLRSGAVTVVRAETADGEHKPWRAIAEVQGHFDTHQVCRWPNGSWTCEPCLLAQPCQHIHAAQLVLGGAS